VHPATLVQGPGVRLPDLHGLRNESEDESDGEGVAYSDSEAGWAEEQEVAPEDEQALALFMAPVVDSRPTRTLSDIILERIRAKQDAAALDTLPE
jgi:essential nuclear protein 1